MLPNMAATLTSWQIPLIWQKVKQNVVDGELVPTIKNTKFLAVIQPMSDERLQFKQEGQRSWSWYLIHTNNIKIPFQTGDKILYDNQRFKIMAIKNYRLYGYKEIEAVLDYESYST